jgi:hypothetical protein
LNYQEQGTGTPLVLLHGFPLDSRIWREQIANLSDRFRARSVPPPCPELRLNHAVCGPPSPHRSVCLGTVAALLAADALEATLPPREDRNTAAPLFPGCSADRLLARARRRVSRCPCTTFVTAASRSSIAQGRSWAEIARFVGQRKLSIRADTYTHVLSDGREARLSPRPRC